MFIAVCFLVAFASAAAQPVSEAGRIIKFRRDAELDSYNEIVNY